MRDIDIRCQLRKEVRQHHRGELGTRFVEELGLCQGIVRVDLAVVNGSVHGYEIKSEEDTLARLPGQVEVYNRSLDRVTIVAASAHIKKIENEKMVPPWWGIWAAVDSDGIQLEKVREAGENPHIDAFALAQLLWRDEALQALAEKGLDVGVRSKPREELWRRLVSNLTLNELGGVVRECLKRRDANWGSAASQA